MKRFERLRHIGAELKGHAPFTLIGALVGLVCLLGFRAFGKVEPELMFKIFHPGHVILSAMVTASLFSLHKEKKNYLLILVVGYVGSIGVATLSDCVIPYAGEKLFGLDIPAHAAMHDCGHAHEEGEECAVEELVLADEQDAHAGHDHTEGEICETEKGSDPFNSSEHQEHGEGLHLGFIEEWYIVNPAAILGVIIACFIPRTKCPHAAHVLLSTWASGSHILMNMESELTATSLGVIFVILFMSVWLPCCVSDIVFPLLFVKSDLRIAGGCGCHGIHSHKHEHAENGGQ